MFLMKAYLMNQDFPRDKQHYIKALTDESAIKFFDEGKKKLIEQPEEQWVNYRNIRTQ